MVRLAAFLLAGVAAVSAFAVYAEPPADPGDDPPVLKKKGAPGADDPAPPAADEDKDKDGDRAKKPDDADKPAADKGAPEQPPRPDADEVLKGVTKSMHAAEERLAKKEINDATRQAEEDALKGLDSLIDLTENPPPDPNDKKDDASKSSDSSSSKSDASKSSSAGAKSSSSGPSSRKPGQGRQMSRGRRTKPGAGTAPPGTEPRPGSQGDRQPQDSASSSTGDTGGANGNAGGTNKPQNPKDPNADLYKNVWGHLPETLRAEMNAYSNTKGFMPEYESLISRYYSTIAEQGRRKGD